MKRTYIDLKHNLLEYRKNMEFSGDIHILKLNSSNLCKIVEMLI